MDGESGKGLQLGNKSRPVRQEGWGGAESVGRNIRCRPNVSQQPPEERGVCGLGKRVCEEPGEPSGVRAGRPGGEPGRARPSSRPEGWCVHVHVLVQVCAREYGFVRVCMYTCVYTRVHMREGGALLQTFEDVGTREVKRLRLDYGLKKLTANADPVMPGENL